MFKKFLDRRKRATEFEAKRRRLPKAGRRFVFSIKVKPLFSLSLSLSSAKRMKTGRKATRGNRTREGVLGLTFLCVCVCSRTAFFSRSACDVFCITDVEESARVCKNYEERSASFSTKKNEKRQKSTRWENEETRARARRKKNKALFSLPFKMLSVRFTKSGSFITLVVEKTYTHKRDGERENDPMWEKKDDTLKYSTGLRVHFIYTRGPSST